MARDTGGSQAKMTQKRMNAAEMAAADNARKRARKSDFKVKSEHSSSNPIHRRLQYHEKKLLRKHDFLQYEQDLWHEPFCIKKYNLEDREDYRRYLRLVGLVRSLMSQLRYLPAESKVRIEITQQIVDKLYDMGLIHDKQGLAEVDKTGVEAFCKRRLPSMMVQLKMAPNCKIASDYIHHGHVRVGTNQVRDPAMLVPRTMDDYVTWMPGSKVKRHIDTFNQQRDDFDDA